MRPAAIPAVSTTRWRDLIVFAAAWAFAVAFIAAVLAEPRSPGDALAYWRTWHGPLYGVVDGSTGYIYPPVAVLLFLPAAVLPWPAFCAAWLTLLVACALWLVWPLPVRLRIPIFAALAASLVWGNIATLLAVGLVLVPRRPALWALQAWVKLTPVVGAVSLLAQRRWHDFALAVLVTAAIGAGMLLFAPGATASWIHYLLAHQEVPSYWLAVLPWSPPLALRLAVAAGVAYFGASRPWTLAIAAAIATPDLSLSTCGVLAAIPRLARG